MSEKEVEALEKIGKRDHSITNEYRIVGPPGTGKTRRATNHIYSGVDRFGGNSVMATSFTKTAAIELADRDVPVDLDRIGTLHSCCFHALGKPQIAEAHIDEWNRENPRFRITAVSRDRRLDGEDSHAEEESVLRSGDHLLQQLNCCRGRMLSPENWPAPVREFASKWSRYKTANDLLDFADLIDTAQRDLEFAPHKPSVIIADEAQDLNPMQMTLLREWGRATDHFVLAGDDDQTIYGWSGASADAILYPEIPEDHKIFLTKSQRVPRAVNALAEKLIHRVSQRQAKAYEPRDVAGEVKRLSQGYKSPEYSILKTIERHLSERKRIMVLGSCSYMLKPILAALRREGIPFHNPYRKSNGFWNVLRMGSRQSAANRILSLLIAHAGFGIGHRSWRGGELALWAEWLPEQGILTEHGREIIAALPPMKEASAEILAAVFQPIALVEILGALQASTPISLLDWWKSRVFTAFRQRIQFPGHIAVRRGGGALADLPRVIVGTIHSVKGGEADVVYLFPDLSKAGDAQYRQLGAARDSVIRQFYVGVTRARETLYLCSPESGAAISI